MIINDWLADAAYQYADNIPIAGFAWEYLRRDEDYRRNFETLNRMEAPPVIALEAFSQRWGLRFPARSSVSS